ncbi:DUF1405 domain-containing protein [Paenibacillus sp. MER 99-2]|uniref:DUF1405 domain-containing protein n=1 Tax=Paenibacillus sp. MER 99-2 TaxID=2939572 RepID=UPI00203B3E07|nr:DUF1405 domain-containing protein [Paenibacillus sp. MER 99-2]
MSLSFFWSKEFLTNRYFLWLLFWCNALGTVYGYIWYGDQLVDTLEKQPLWQIVFVPDSPTASLFFTLSLLWILYNPKSLWVNRIGHVIQALAVVTSVKYGVWAISIIFAGWSQGNVAAWQDWMLIASHGAMAIEALLYVRFFGFRWVALLIAALWTLLNDTMDYTYDIYPWLPYTLWEHVDLVRNFTVVLTLLSILVSWLALRQAKRS